MQGQSKQVEEPRWQECKGYEVSSWVHVLKRQNLIFSRHVSVLGAYPHPMSNFRQRPQRWCTVWRWQPSSWMRTLKTKLRSWGHHHHSYFSLYYFLQKSLFSAKDFYYYYFIPKLVTDKDLLPQVRKRSCKAIWYFIIRLHLFFLEHVIRVRATFLVAQKTIYTPWMLIWKGGLTF